MTTTTRTRCFRVEIETPPDDAAKSIAYHRETVIEVDGALLGKTAIQPASLRMPFRDIATVVRTVIDPVTKQPMTGSAAGIAAWITADYEDRNAADAAAIAAAAAAPSPTPAPAPATPTPAP